MALPGVDLIVALLQDHSLLVPDTSTIPGRGGDAQSLSARYVRGVVPASSGKSGTSCSKMSQSWETKVRLTGCGGHLLGRGCTFSLLIGSLPLLHQKNI